jgi:hypothetical protein
MCASCALPQRCIDRLKQWRDLATRSHPADRRKRSIQVGERWRRWLPHPYSSDSDGDPDLDGHWEAATCIRGWSVADSSIAEGL